MCAASFWMSNESDAIQFEHVGNVRALANKLGDAYVGFPVATLTEVRDGVPKMFIRKKGSSTKPVRASSFFTTCSFARSDHVARDFVSLLQTRGSETGGWHCRKAVHLARELQHGYLFVLHNNPQRRRQISIKLRLLRASVFETFVDAVRERRSNFFVGAFCDEPLSNEAFRFWLTKCVDLPVSSICPSGKPECQPTRIDCVYVDCASVAHAYNTSLRVCPSLPEHSDPSMPGDVPGIMYLLYSAN